MAHRQNTQPTLADNPNTGHRYRYCRRCRRPLTDPESCRIGYGPDCDPTRRLQPAPVRPVDQDVIPGT